MKIGICGHFGGERVFLDGQTIKTKELKLELERIYGNQNIIIVDSFNAKKKILSYLYKTIKCIKDTDNTIILPAKNSLRVFTLLFRTILRPSIKKIHYVVVGGWLPDLVETNLTIKNTISKFKGIYVETESMRSHLMALGLTNVYTMHNFKHLTILKPEELTDNSALPMKLCTFSRVMREKGIGEAVTAVEQYNHKAGKNVFSLDIYGQVDSAQTKWFKTLKENFSESIHYMGCVPAEKSTELLMQYYALLFPTYYEGEGGAGTLIDAFASGTPVVASDWKYNSEIVIQGKTGILVKPADSEALEEALGYLEKHTEEWNAMKQMVLEQAHKYTPDVVVKSLTERL